MKKSEKIIDHVYRSFGIGLKPMLVACFDTVDEILYGIAQRADNPRKQKMYIESLRSFRVHRLNVLMSFIKSLQQASELFKQHEYNFEKVLCAIFNNEITSVSMHENDVEEKHLQNSIIHNSEETYKDTIEVLRHYFSILIGSELTDQQIPIGPNVLIIAFSKSIRLLHLDQQIKLIIYKHFELKVMNNLEELYQKTIKKIEHNYTDENKQPIERFSDLEHSQKSANSRNGKEENYTISMTVILSCLDEIQLNQDNCNSDPQRLNISPSTIKQNILDKLGHIQLTQSRHIDYLVLYAIDLISMKFQLIADDNNLPISIQNIIIKLHIPYLKFALSDESILENKDHVALVLLELFHRSSIGWSEKLDKNNHFFDQLISTVNKITMVKVLSIDFFKQCLHEYQQFLDEKESEFAKEQEKIKTREMGKDRIVLAMKTVDALTQHKIENVRMPDVVKNIIMGPWKNLLSLLLVRYSDTSKEYLHKVNFIDDLLMLLKSKQYETIIEAKIEELCQVYKDGLELVAYTGDELKEKINALKQSLLTFHKLDEESKKKRALLDNTNENYLDKIVTKKHVVIQDEKRPIQQNTVSHNDPISQNDNDLSDSQKLELLEFKIGINVEFQRQNNSAVTAKLSWINPRSGKYIFVNNQGLKVTDKSPIDLLSGINDSSIKILSSE